MERGHGHQSGRLFQHRQGRLPRHARAQMGSDRQYRIDQRSGRAIWPGQLRCGEKRHPRLYQGAGTGRRARRGDGQRDRAGLYRYRHGGGGACRCSRKDRCEDSGRTAGSGERDRARGCVPVLGRGRVRDGVYAVDQWWAAYVLTGAGAATTAPVREAQRPARPMGRRKPNPFDVMDGGFAVGLKRGTPCLPSSPRLPPTRHASEGWHLMRLERCTCGLIPQLSLG
ncbi:hypothetical protein SPHINGOAX6_50251 [Sphingomonas sp. AX6]|nr:hypothetical protein SPHINGOAX6_50251 [Sphingomonas sp. AX6]